MGKWCNKKWLDNHKKGNQKLHSHWQLAQMEQEKTLQRGAIVLPFKHLSSNCIISNLFYCLTIEQFLIQVPSEVGHACRRGASKIAL